MPTRLNERNHTSTRILRPPHDPPHGLWAGAGQRSCIRDPNFQNQCSACRAWWASIAIWEKTICCARL